MFVASEEATSGSVIAKHERISPASSGFSQRSFCSGVPYRASTSMLPVSGAEQLNTSGAIVAAPHDFAQRRVFQVGEPRAVFVIRQKKIPKPGGARFRLQFFHHARRRPSIALEFRPGSAARSDRRARP